MKIKKCLCCDQVIKNYGLNRYCSSCALHHKYLTNKMNYLKLRIKKKNKSIYGQEDGRQRIR